MVGEDKDLLVKITKIVPLVAITCGVFGFFIWNIHLSRLGFIEYDIIQTRFILTGLIFLLSVYVIIFIINIIICHLRYLNTKIFKGKIIENLFTPKIFSKYVFNFSYGFVSFILLYLICFIYFIFPATPSWIGGGSPRFLAIIAEKEEVGKLESFGVGKPSGGPYQTQNLCIAYENENKIIFLLEDRVLELKKDYLKGFVSLPSKEKSEAETACLKRLYTYLFFQFRSMLPNSCTE